jgi:hypothetical protein
MTKGAESEPEPIPCLEAEPATAEAQSTGEDKAISEPARDDAVSMMQKPRGAPAVTAAPPESAEP